MPAGRAAWRRRAATGLAWPKLFARALAHFKRIQAARLLNGSSDNIRDSFISWRQNLESTTIVSLSGDEEFTRYNRSECRRVFQAADGEPSERFLAARGLLNFLWAPCVRLSGSLG